MIYYDFHIHSCLSPCADDDMTPNNIVNMAMIKGLDMIAICDHNSSLQLPAFSKLDTTIKIIYGIEVETMEEVHILGLFKKLEDNMAFDRWLDTYKLKTKNDIHYFGNQLIMDEQDNVINNHPYLLITSTQISLNECISQIHKYHGIVVLAHVLDRKNSIINQLGFIPKNIEADAIEVKSEEQIQLIKKMYPFLQNKVFMINSDAHHLVDISEKTNALDEDIFHKLWE